MKKLLSLGEIWINLGEIETATDPIDITSQVDVSIIRYFQQIFLKRMASDNVNIVPTKKLGLHIDHDLASDSSFHSTSLYISNPDSDSLNYVFGNNYQVRIESNDNNVVKIFLKQQN